MKLELKHLAPYLPYGLRLFHAEYKAKHILDISIKEVIYDSEMSAVTLTAMVNGNEYLKPLLRPLSDLTKEIEHNGEKFVPSELLNFDFSDLSQLDYEYIPYNLATFLLEHHFDIFGLIENGLAIDINTLCVEK